MGIKIDEGTHIGRCRCEECAAKYQPKSHKNTVYYYVAPQYVPDELLCNNCFNKVPPKHGGIIISKEALTAGVAVFARGPAWKLTEKQKKNAAQIWP